MSYLILFLLIIWCSCSSAAVINTSSDNDQIIAPAGSSFGSASESSPTGIETLAESVGLKRGNGLLLPAPANIIKINKQNTQQAHTNPHQTTQISEGQTSNNAGTGLNKTLNSQGTQSGQNQGTKLTSTVTSSPTVTVSPTPSSSGPNPKKSPSTPTPHTPPIPPLAPSKPTPTISIPISSSPISGSWSFSVVNTQKQISTIPVQITNTQITFSYCNDIVLSYKINKSQLSVYLISQLPKVCPNLSPSQTKVLSSIINVDSYSLNGTKLYLQAAGINKVAFVK